MTAHLAWSWTMHSIYNHHIDTSNYRDGSFDRPANGRRVGP
jgi:hypothetical protein